MKLGWKPQNDIPKYLYEVPPVVDFKFPEEKQYLDGPASKNFKAQYTD